MTDIDLLYKRLAFTERMVSELRKLAKPHLIHTDPKEERFAEHTLQLAIQSILDAAAHIIASERLAEPSDARAMFGILAKEGWIDHELASLLDKATGFRNVIVHLYLDVNLDEVERVLRERRGHLEAFCTQVRARLQHENPDTR